MKTVFLFQFVYLVTGVLTTIVNQVLVYHGFDDKLLLCLPTYLGMAFVGLTGGTSESEKADTTSWMFFGIAVVDVSASFACVLGLAFAGSGIYQVVYSSNVAFTAILAMLLLKKPIGNGKWLAIVVITIGLAWSANPHSFTESGGESVSVGIMCTLVATFLFALLFVVNENVVTSAGAGGKPVCPLDLCCSYGTFGSCMLMVYVCFKVVPDIELLKENIIAHGGTVSMASFCFSFLIFNAWAHNAALFFFLREAGSVATGVLQGMRAVLVFAASAALFCERQQSQCLDNRKLTSALLVVAGVLIFSFSADARKDKRKVEVENV